MCGFLEILSIEWQQFLIPSVTSLWFWQAVFVIFQVFNWKQLENLYYRDKKFSIEVHDTKR